MIFKVAMLKKRAKNAQINDFFKGINKSMKEASKNNTDILVLPECFINGYDLPMIYEKSISNDKDMVLLNS